MKRNLLFLSTALILSSAVVAGLPEALMNLNYEQYSASSAAWRDIMDDAFQV